jgi:ABC-type sugar transport system substrate-binding protein
LTSRNTARTVATKEQGVRQADIEAFVDGRSTPGRSEVADAEPHYEIDCRMLDPRRVALTRAALLRAGIGAGLTLPLLGGILEQTAYAKPSERSRSTVGNGKTIALSLNGFNVYDQQLATGVLQVLAGTAYKFKGLQGNFDSKAEVTNLQNLVAQNPAGLLIIPNTVAGASRGALAAKRAGIPVVNLLWSGKTSADSAYVGVIQVDNKVGGALMADYLGKKVKSGKILVVIGVPGQGFSEDITAGLEVGLKKYPGLQIADSQPGLFTAGPAQKAVQNMLTAHPDAKAIVDYAAEMGNGIAQYLKARKITNVEHITSDGNTAMIPWLKQGTYLSACRYYSSGQEGLIGCTMMRKYIEKQQKPAKFVTSLYQKMVTKANLKGQPPLTYDKYMSIVKKIG